MDASLAYWLIAGLGWLGYAINRKTQTDSARDLKLMIGVSVYALTATCVGHRFGLLLPFLIVVEAFGVTPILTKTLSHVFVSFLTAFHSTGSPVPVLSAARHARKLGRLEEALDLALTELVKDPGHYEGNYLLAEIYWERREVPSAFFCLVRILDNPQCSEEQRLRIRQEFDQALTLARQRGWIPPDSTESSVRQSLPAKLDRPRIE